MISNTVCYHTLVDSTAYSSIPGAVADGFLTPLQIATAYNIPAGTGAGVKIGIFSAGGTWKYSDFNKSMTDLGLPITSSNITTILVDGSAGGWTNSSYDIENTIDLYCVAGMAPSANIVLFVGNNTSTNAGIVANWNNIINRMVAEKCDIITMSYAIDESTVIASGFSGFLETAFANATSKGTTILAATGDHGSAGNQNLSILNACYPATSPNVVAVGGTILTVNTDGTRATELVDSSSAGGISTIFPVPTWQTGLTANVYFTSNGYSHVSTITGRGVPDISAPYAPYAFYLNGSVTTGYGGTSFACPVLAGMMARYMSNNGGRRPIPGAIHKILYGNTSAYSDLTVGNNASDITVGFVANVGWDPITGLGPPKGTTVYQMVTSGGTTIKTAANTWSYVANVQVKTDTNTWANVKSIWTKTINGWQQSY